MQPDSQSAHSGRTATFQRMGSVYGPRSDKEARHAA